MDLFCLVRVTVFASFLLHLTHNEDDALFLASFCFLFPFLNIVFRCRETALMSRRCGLSSFTGRWFLPPLPLLSSQPPLSSFPFCLPSPSLERPDGVSSVENPKTIFVLPVSVGALLLHSVDGPWLSWDRLFRVFYRFGCSWTRSVITKVITRHVVSWFRSFIFYIVGLLLHEMDHCVLPRLLRIAPSLVGYSFLIILFFFFLLLPSGPFRPSRCDDWRYF